MIKRLSIKNFRNLAELEIDLAQTTIISGKNELGKSNALNALMWLTTGTILTDKWGSGENDIDSIVPKNATRGINPEVAIYLETGTKFSKKYITKYSKDGTKVTGHTTEFYVNDVACKNEKEFIETLYPLLNLKLALKTKDVNELRLFTDPLYALQKLDAKALRALLVDLGCSVTDEELYQLGFEDLRPYGNQYLGKWDVFRKTLKDKINVLTKDIESIQAKLETVASIDKYDESKLIELNKKLEETIGKKANIRANNKNPEINEIETKIAVLKNTIETKIANHRNDIQKEKNNLLIKRQNVLDKLNQDSNTKATPILNELSKVQSEINSTETAIKAYQVTMNNNRSMMDSYVALGKNNQTKKNDLAVKLDVVRNSTYTGKITCPICGNEFADSQEKEQEFYQHQKEDIQNLIDEISKCDSDNTKYKEEYFKCQKLRDDAAEEINKTTDKLVELKSNLLDLQQKAAQLKSEPIDMTEVNKIDEEIKKLDYATPDTTKEEKELNELDVRLNNLKNANETLIQDEINALDVEISSIRESISNEIVAKSKYAEKIEYETKLADTQKTLNDNEFLLGRCNALINTMISKINEKATAITGLTFVMLEENISNDGVKEVCYATIDNIPFKDVNTAKKLKYGIKFIEKMKELLGQNQLPILADRMEGIDSVDTIKNLTQEQLICTRVSDNEKITIL